MWESCFSIARDILRLGGTQVVKSLAEEHCHLPTLFAICLSQERGGSIDRMLHEYCNDARFQGRGFPKHAFEALVRDGDVARAVTLPGVSHSVLSNSDLSAKVKWIHAAQRANFGAATLALDGTALQGLDSCAERGIFSSLAMLSSFVSGDAAELSSARAINTSAVVQQRWGLGSEAALSLGELVDTLSERLIRANDGKVDDNQKITCARDCIGLSQFGANEAAMDKALSTTLASVAFADIDNIDRLCQDSVNTPIQENVLERESLLYRTLRLSDAAALNEFSRKPSLHSCASLRP